MAIRNRMEYVEATLVAWLINTSGLASRLSDLAAVSPATTLPAVNAIEQGEKRQPQSVTVFCSCLTEGELDYQAGLYRYPETRLIVRVSWGAYTGKPEAAKRAAQRYAQALTECGLNTASPVFGPTLGDAAGVVQARPMRTAIDLDFGDGQEAEPHYIFVEQTWQVDLAPAFAT